MRAMIPVVRNWPEPVTKAVPTAHPHYKAGECVKTLLDKGFRSVTDIGDLKLCDTMRVFFELHETAGERSTMTNRARAVRRARTRNPAAVTVAACSSKALSSAFGAGMRSNGRALAVIASHNSRLVPVNPSAGDFANQRDRNHGNRWRSVTWYRWR